MTTLAEVKAFLRVNHDEDDAMLTALMLSAEDELASYLGVSELPNKPAVITSVCLLVRSNYETESPDDAARWRDVARNISHGYRVGIGI